MSDFAPIDINRKRDRSLMGRLEESMFNAREAMTDGLFLFRPHASTFNRIVGDTVTLETAELPSSDNAMLSVVLGPDNSARIPRDELGLRGKADLLQEAGLASNAHKADYMAMTWLGVEVVANVAAEKAVAGLDLRRVIGCKALRGWIHQSQTIILPGSDYSEKAIIDDEELRVYMTKIVPLQIASGLIHLALSQMGEDGTSSLISELNTQIIKNSSLHSCLRIEDNLAIAAPFEAEFLHEIFLAPLARG